MIVLLAELVLTSVRLALSLKVIFTQLILSSVQIVVLAQMYVLLKQFTRLNNTIYKKYRLLSTEGGLFYFPAPDDLRNN